LRYKASGDTDDGGGGMLAVAHFGDVGRGRGRRQRHSGEEGWHLIRVREEEKRGKELK